MSEVIEVFQRPLPGTRTKERPCLWEAACVHMGKNYAEASRGGATHELARTLINAGIQHGAVLVVRTEGREGALTTPSISEWARWTYSGERRVLWEKAQASLEALRERSA